MYLLCQKIFQLLNNIRKVLLLYHQNKSNILTSDVSDQIISLDKLRTLFNKLDIEIDRLIELCSPFIKKILRSKKLGGLNKSITTVLLNK